LNNHTLLKDPRNSVGIWKDPESGKWSVDVTTTHPEKGFAEFAGKAANQKGITHLDGNTFEYVPTGGTGLSKAGLPKAEGRIDSLYKDYLKTKPVPESTVLYNEPAKIEATTHIGTAREAPALVDIAHVLNNYTKEQGDVLPPGALPAERYIDKASQAAKDEALRQLKEDVSGRDWYEKDLEDFQNKMIEYRPELKDPTQLKLYKSIVAMTSPAMDPKTNLGVADRVYEEFKRTGKIPVTQANRQRWGIQVNPDSLARLQKLITDKGAGPAMDWLLAEHPVEELSPYASKGGFGVISRGAEEGKAYGSQVFGPKIGRFIQNLNGNHDVLTADRWFSRTWNRWMGTMFDDKGAMVEAPRTPKEFSIMQKSMETAAKELGMKVDELQATLWSYEKELYRRQGYDESKTTGTYSQAADQFRNGRFNFENEGGGAVPNRETTPGGNKARPRGVPGRNLESESRFVMPATAQHPDLKSTLLDLLKEEHELSSEAERLKRVLEHGGDVTLREGSNDEEEKEPTEIAEKSSEAMAR
jgi:hypothetical protein